MNIQDLGSVGELVAGLATIATLVYLAIQIQRNTSATRATSAREIIFHLSEWHQQNVSNPQMLSNYHKCLQDPMPEFTEAEWLEMNSYCKSLFHILEAQYVHSRFKVGTGFESEPHLRGASTLVSQFPVWRKFWEEEKANGHWTEGFAEAIESMQPGAFPFATSDVGRMAHNMKLKRTKEPVTWLANASQVTEPLRCLTWC